MTTKEPQFCIIAPTAYLDYAEQSNSHLVLAHLVDTDDNYASFYSNMDNATIFMDNSAYELKEPYSPHKLLDLARKCNATAIVLPDYPFQESSVTIDAAEEFIPIFKNAGFDTFFVPQSLRGDAEDWIAAYEYASGHPDIDIIGMSILGIPNAMPWCSPAYARVVMTHNLIERDLFNFDKHHHYLGLNAGPALEIPSLIRLGALDTIDSSGPVYSALCGHRYTYDADSYQQVSKLKTPVDFSISRTKDIATLQRIQHNIDLTLNLFNHPFSPDLNSWYAEE